MSRIRQKRMESNFRWAVYFGGSALLLACAGTPQKVTDLPVNVNTTDNPNQQIAVLESEFRRAHIEAVPLFSPTWFEQASESFDDAKEARNSSEDREEMFRELAEARAQLDKAFQVADFSKKTLPDVVEARRVAYASRQKAIEAGAMEMEELTDRLKDADEELVDLTENIERDDVPGAMQDKQDVIREYAEARHFGIEKSALDLAERRIDQAESEDAEDYSPQALLLAREKLKLAENFGEQDVVDDDRFEELANEAAFYAQKALDTNRQAVKYGKSSPEQIAQGVDRKVGELTSQRDAALQSATQAGQVAAKAQSKEAAVEARKEKLAAVRSMFTQKEAEVFEQDGQIVIRLLGLKFPSGATRLAGENYALLDKLEDALIEFDGAGVTVEGHTDSTGSASKNYEISQARANAVRQYLLAHDAVDTDKLAAVGLGDDQPIKPNKTKEGRMANRRVDIVIVDEVATAR